MKASKFSEAQIAFVLKQAEDGTAVGEVCRKVGVSEATFHNWRKRYAGLMPSEVKRLRQLEEENAELTQLIADLSLDKAMLQDVLQKSTEACPPSPACRSGAGGLEGVGAEGMRGPAYRPLPLYLQVQARREGRIEAADQGDLRDAVRYGYLSLQQIEADSSSEESRSPHLRTHRVPSTTSANYTNQAIGVNYFKAA